MSAFIAPPTKVPLFLRLGIWISEKITGKFMLPARLLAWYPKAAIGSGVLEGLVAHQDGKLDKRMFKLVRLSAAFTAACPFCIDMNSAAYEETGISGAELLALQQQTDLDAISTFTLREKLAMRYARLISCTPLQFPSERIAEIIAHFTEREMVILASDVRINQIDVEKQGCKRPPAMVIRIASQERSGQNGSLRTAEVRQRKAGCLG